MLLQAIDTYGALGVLDILVNNAGFVMTEGPFAEAMAAPESGLDAMHPGNVAPVVACLSSVEALKVTGCVIEVEGGRICPEDRWRHGSIAQQDARWVTADVGLALQALIAGAPAPEPGHGAQP